jgi:SAM-dependent methyltransferase
VLKAAVQLALDYDFVDLKRAWLDKHRIGYWDTSWTQQTERRPTSYFDRYDQHIRCWIPPYNALISRCAAVVAQEILHIRQATGKPVFLLEIGYGTGSLTANIVPWIQQLRGPSKALGDLPPVAQYHAVDRADRMYEIASRQLGSEGVYLLKQIAWREVREDMEYDIIFGSLVMHFMMDKGVGADSAADFFGECYKRLRTGGTLVFSDSFGLDPDAESVASDAYQQWRDSMVSNGLSEEYTDSFLAGNSDMKNAFSFEELKSAAADHGLVAECEYAVSNLPIFKVVVFRKSPQDTGAPAASAT